MTDQTSPRTAARRPRPRRHAAETEALLIDDAFDDLLDPIAAIRESLAEFRHV
jgi:hypothetical protein